MTRPVFRFDDFRLSGDGDTLSCRCPITADMPFFKGHFDGLPLMPAAAQLAMLQVLLHQQPGWSTDISGGRGLKFSGRIGPGDKLTLRLQRKPHGDIGFSIENAVGVVSKGTLELAGDAHD